MRGIGKRLKLEVNGFKVDIYQPDPSKCGVSVRFKGHFKARDGVNYVSLSNSIQKGIKSIIKPYFNKSIIVIDIPIRIVNNRVSMITTDVNIQYAGNDIKKDNELMLLIKSIVDNCLVNKL